MLSYHFLTDCAKHGYNLVFEYKGEVVKTSFKEAAANYKEFMSKYDIATIALHNPHLKFFANMDTGNCALYDPECWEVMQTEDENSYAIEHLHYKGTSSKPAQPLGLTDLYSLFRSCQNLTELDLSDWVLDEDLADVTAMFEDCEKLRTIKLPILPDICTTNRMFRNCYNLKEINWECFKESNLVACDSMFANCWVLEDFKINDLKFKQSFSAKAMFANCARLTDDVFQQIPVENAILCANMFLGTGVKNVKFKAHETLTAPDFSGMFSHCPSLEQLKIKVPPAVKITKEDVADSCPKLKAFSVSSAKKSQEKRVASMAIF